MFSLVSVSGYLVDKIVELAQERLLTIVLGGLVCVIISIVACLVWASEDLHMLVTLNMEKLADFLEVNTDSVSSLIQVVKSTKATMQSGRINNVFSCHDPNNSNGSDVHPNDPYFDELGGHDDDEKRFKEVWV